MIAAELARQLLNNERSLVNALSAMGNQWASALARIDYLENATGRLQDLQKRSAFVGHRGTH